MKKNAVIIAAIILIAALVSTQFLEQLIFSIDSRETLNEIVAQNTRWLNAYKDNDIDTLVGLYTDDASLLPPNDTMKRGKSAIRLYFETLPRSGIKVLDASMISDKIITNNSTIYEIGEYTITIKPVDSDASRTDKGKYLTIWKYQSDGSLRMYAECWNSDTPAEKTDRHPDLYNFME